MTDPRWAALAAEIAYEIEPVSAVIPAKEIRIRVTGFKEPTTEKDKAQLSRAKARDQPERTGPWPRGACLMLVDQQEIGAELGSIARVIGYYKQYVLVQWSRDELSPRQYHGEYNLDQFTLVAEDDPF